MKNYFSTQKLHTITEANINYYTVPFVHPSRKMKEHDFIYLLQGAWVLGQNDKNYELCEDSLLILFAENKHYGRVPCMAGTKTMYFHVSCEEGDLYGEPLTEHLAGYIGIDTLIHVGDNPNIRTLFEKIVISKLSEEHRKADLYFELLLCELSVAKSNLKEIEIANTIREIIHSYPEKFWSNKELADRTNVSVKTAEMKFKAAFGETIHQYILNFKIKEAMNYFDRFHNISVKEVAYNLGFCDEYHFSRQFFRRTGVSPGNYKKNLKIE